MMEWQIGGTSLRRVVESEIPMLSPFEIFPDCTPELLAANLPWLAPRFYDPAAGRLVITIQSFLLRQNGLTILVDSCSGNDKERARPAFRGRQWPWLEALRDAGAAPEDIDIVFCTHMHVDHVGWNTRLENGRWVPTFPKARYLFGRREWEYWQSEAGIGSLPRTGDYISDSVLPIIRSGQAELIDADYGIAPSMWLERLPGHTPGLMALHIAADGKEAILPGDLMHHHLQLRYPHWSTRFCADQAMARETRARFLETNAGTGKLVFPSHFPTPTGGLIERDGGHFRFVYDGE